MNRLRDVVYFLRALVSAYRLIRKPTWLREVVVLSYVVVKKEHRALFASALKEDPEIGKSFAGPTRVGRLDYDFLKRLAPGTLGREYYEFLQRNNLDPTALPDLPVKTDSDYTLAHLYETHDIHHVVAGFGTDVAGELGVQSLYTAQYTNRHALLLMAFGLINEVVHNVGEQDQRMRAIVRGWLIGKTGRVLFGVDWKKMWHLPLTEVRAQLGIDLEAIDGMLDENVGKFLDMHKRALAAAA